jgi:L-amino acid N-acyltransferase YncA
MTDRAQLRAAMVRHLSLQLTPAAAAAIEAEAFHVPEASIDPTRFAPVQHGHYSIQVESFRGILEELAPLHAEHFAETEKHRHGLQLRPDYDGIAARERAGRALQFTVRRDGELAGHLLMYLFRSTHTQTLVAEEDTLFMRPAHRGGMTAVALLRYAERVLIELGVREIRANSKLINNADVLMRRMRYQPVAIQFVKMLRAPDASLPAKQDQ